jgi:hypothetical protein
MTPIERFCEHVEGMMGLTEAERSYVIACLQPTNRDLHGWVNITAEQIAQIRQPPATDYFYGNMATLNAYQRLVNTADTAAADQLEQAQHRPQTMFYGTPWGIAETNG